MKREIYFQSTFQRQGEIEQTISAHLFTYLQFPRLLLEVFIRKNLGERYFSMGIAVFMFCVLFYLPIHFAPQLHALDMMTDKSFMSISDVSGMKAASKFSYLKFIFKNITWYGFISAFIYSAFLRNQEIKRLPSVFDFGRLSTVTGDIHPLFKEVKWKGQLVNERQIETLIEPLFFFTIGIILIVFHQLVGYLIVIASIGYSISYVLAYHHGDHFIMNKIDQMILGEEINSAVVEGKSPNETRGTKFYGRVPNDPGNRRRVVDSMFGDEPYIVT